MINSSFTDDGFKVCANVINAEQVSRLREEADRVATEAGSTCVRHLCKLSKTFHDLARSQALLDLLPGNLRPVRSILFDKTADENWPVVWHQDLTIAVKENYDVRNYGPWSFKDGFPHVQPPVSLLENMVTIRLHLDDTLKTNGALRVIPASHLLGKMNSNSITEQTKHAIDDQVICGCLAGDALLMKPLILHASSRSEIPNRRRVVHFEYACDEDLDRKLEWAESR